MKLPEHIANKVLDCLCKDDSFLRWYESLPTIDVHNLGWRLTEVIRRELDLRGVEATRPASDLDV